MKKLALLFLAGLMSSALTAQELPKPSPLGKTEQKVGLTDVSVEYSRPSVKGRTIFGDLVPYNTLWRLGANACTKFTTSTDMKVAGKALPAGTYALFATPMEDGTWQIDFNSNTKQSGTGDYDAKLNVVSVKVKATDNSFNETFTIGFNNVTANSAHLSIEWEKLRVDVPFTVNTAKNAEMNIEAAIKEGKDLDKVYYSAASYYMSAVEDMKKATMYIDKSLAVKEAHNSLFLKARILHADGQKDKAIETASKALEMAKAADSKGWASYIEGTIADWKK
jgi:tetratricopeptide (TPR) repeat protein